MPEPPHPDQLTFKIHPAAGGSEVPVSILIQSLTSLQELIHLFALQEEGRTFRQRLRLPEEIANKYVLCCRPPQSGSFAVVGRVTNRTDDLLANEKIARVMHNFHEFNHAAVRAELDVMAKVLPDGRVRARALSCLVSLSPPAGSGHTIELFNGAGPGVVFDESVPVRLERLLKSPEARAEVQTVTGRLEAVSFSERKLTVNYAPKGRWLECSYDESVELMLLENRRDLIQVTGRVIMDEDGHPKKIVEVEQVRDLDMSPFVLGEIPANGFTLKPRRVLQCAPHLSDSQQLICLQNDDWGLDVFAPTRSELFEELKEQLAMLWLEFAREVDDALSPPARQVKRQLQSDWEEVVSAKG
ncbi:MAG TPA: hypothetical protein VH595_20500 [Verrucomicrobiae bacterium]|nr:hypothetical protein [Verrucomicrobiae bacterium]